MLKRELRGSPVPCVSLCAWCYNASPASVHRNKAPSRASPDLTPACAPIVPTTAPAPTRATPSGGVVPTSTPTRVTPSGGVSKTDTDANTGSRHSWTTPTPTTAAPGHSRATSAPAGTVPASTAPSSSSEPAVDAGAMKAAAAEPRPRRGVGRNQRRTQSYDDQCNHCFPEHEDLAIELKKTLTKLVRISLVPAQDHHRIGNSGCSAKGMARPYGLQSGTSVGFKKPMRHTPYWILADAHSRTFHPRSSFRTGGRSAGGTRDSTIEVSR